MRLEERVARFIVPSEFMRHRMLEWGIDDDRVRVIRHFVPISGSEPSDTFGSYGAFFGRLSSEKGLDLLLAALHRSGDPPFLIVGDGPQRPALEDLASKLGLANTKFLGWQSHERVGELVAAARFVAIPSVGEEVASLSALEGLAAARPLLVSDRGALPELVAAGAGLVCRPEDSIDFSERIDELMRDDDLCRRASVKAARMAHALAPQQYLANLEAVYAEAT
jgi:glycosyltransferase involved in cell wall biosynthesis